MIEPLPPDVEVALHYGDDLDARAHCLAGYLRRPEPPDRVALLALADMLDPLKANEPWQLVFKPRASCDELHAVVTDVVRWGMVEKHRKEWIESGKPKGGAIKGAIRTAAKEAGLKGEAHRKAWQRVREFLKEKGSGKAV